jgi:hypothetical protein
MPVHCRHDGTEHPDHAIYCSQCGRPLRASVPPAAQPQQRGEVSDAMPPLTNTEQSRLLDFSCRSETSPAGRQPPLAGGAELAVLVHSWKREDPEQPAEHPLGTRDDLTRVDALLDTPGQIVGWLDVRIGQMATDPPAWSAAVRFGLDGPFVHEAATVLDEVRTNMRRLLWAVGCALVCLVVFKVTSGESSPLWVVATCLAYLGVTRYATRLDQRYSQGPPGPPPPETYS